VVVQSKVVEVDCGEEKRLISAKWRFVDASGRVALLAAADGELSPEHAHPLTTIWERFRGSEGLGQPRVGGQKYSLLGKGDEYAGLLGDDNLMG
jgi:hypothetical protein